MNTTRLGRQLLYGFAWWVVGLSIVPFGRLSVRGRRHVPKGQATLMVVNHVNLFDPVYVYWASLRRLHGVGTDAALRVPVLGALIPWLSVIPFAKGMKDRAAMAEIDRRIKEGAAVLIFPEGNRSWTGRMNPVGAGIGRLAKRLGVPVSFGRFRTGHLQWPRWATYPRFMSVQLEFTEPDTYPEEMDAEEITADIIRRIGIQPEEVSAPRLSWGFRLASGLPDFLWACPSCFSLSGIELVRGASHAVACSGCGARWRLDLSCRMHSERDGIDDTLVDAAYHGILAHFGDEPVADRARFEQDGVLLECPTAQVALVERGVRTARPLGAGALQLTNDRLRLSDGSMDVRLADIKAVLIQLGGHLQVRTADQVYDLTTPGQSKHMWQYFLRRHLRRVRAEVAASAAGADAPRPPPPG